MKKVRLAGVLLTGEHGAWDIFSEQEVVQSPETGAGAVII